MDETDKITNKEDISKATGGMLVEEIQKGSEIQSTNTEIVEENGVSIQNHLSENYSPKPVEIAQQKFYESQKELEDTKIKCWKVLKIVITVIGGLLTLVITILAVFWAYNLSSISEPIGGIKSDITNLKDENKEIKNRIEKNEDKFDNLVNKIYLRN